MTPRPVARLNPASTPEDVGAGYCSACFTGNYPVALGRAGAGELVKLRRDRV
jgi:hypothetical protein